MFKASFLAIFFCFLGYASAIGVCHLSIDKGILCMGINPSDRWGYDSHQHKCVQFTYGGCHGNSNSFLTEKACQQACHPDTPFAD